MKNKISFNDFLKTLQKTNATLDYFVNFKKCSTNIKKISAHLNQLNYLLNKQDLKSEIEFLFNINKECFSVLNLLIAVRDKNAKLLDEYGNLVDLKTYFKDPKQIYDFFKQTGLEGIFKNSEIKNLNDYVFGIEVGLDTNARKNRGGTNFENLIAKKLDKEKIQYKKEVKSTNFTDLDLGKDLKRFDFVIKSKNFTYLIEANFYNSGGSKPNEVARGYTEISAKISLNNKYKFIWITDGQGWLSAKNKLKEAYKSVEIYNLFNLKEFIDKVKNG